MATSDQVIQLANLMKVIKNDTAGFVQDRNAAADAGGVKRGVQGIQATIDHLHANWSEAELKKLAVLNDEMFDKGIRESTTSQFMSKQV
jgi:hypothetical protein